MPEKNTVIYDAYGRPVRRQVLTEEIAGAALTGVRHVWNDTVASGLTPARLAGLLHSAAEGDHNDFLTLAEEMEERDLHYACELGKRKLAVSRLPVSVEAAGESAKEKEIAADVRALTKKHGFRWLLKDMLDALGKGFSVCEIMWDRTGPKWWPGEYKHRDPRWFCWDRESISQVRQLDDANLADGIELEPYKFIVHTPRIKSGLPIRSGYARLAAWAYMCKGYTIKDWLAFAEVFGMPLRMGKYRPGASTDDIDVLKLAVANLGTDAAAVFPEGMQIDFVEAAKSGSSDFFERLAQYLDNQVTKGILGQTATTQGTPGKLGNEEAQTEVRHDFRDDDAEQLEDTIMRDLVRAFVDLNHGPQEAYPTIQLRAPEAEDIVALAASLEKLVPIGLRVEAAYVRDRMGIPDPADDAEVLGAQPAATDAAANHRLAVNQVGTDIDDADMDIAAEDYVQSDWRPAVEDIVEPIRQALAEATGKDDLAQRLAAVFEQQDITALTNSLAAALSIAYAQGAADAD